MDNKDPAIRKELIKRIEVKLRTSETHLKLKLEYDRTHPTGNDRHLETFSQWVFKVTGVDIGE